MNINEISGDNLKSEGSVIHKRKRTLFFVIEYLENMQQM